VLAMGVQRPILSGRFPPFSVCVRGTHPSDGRLVLPAMRQQFLKAAGGLRR
jgi:hypothetical protein